MEDNLTNQLESLVDSHSLETVIEALAEICFLKGEHLRTNWQDKTTAKVWEKVGNKLNNLDCLGL